MIRQPGEEVMMKDVRFLRAPTFSKLFDAACALPLSRKRQCEALLGSGLSFEDGRAMLFLSGTTPLRYDDSAEHGNDNASAHF